MIRLWVLLLVVCCLPGALSLAHADGKEPDNAIEKATFPAVGAVLGLNLLAKSPAKRETGRRVLDAVGLTGALTLGMKQWISSPRPYPRQNEKSGFPSGHTSEAFAVAASISTCHPRAAWVAYPLAAAVGWARADAGAHTWLQVLAGAALGTFIGRQAGQGKLRVFGHKDQSPAPTARTAQVEGGNTEYTASLGPSMQLTMWGTSF